MGTAALGCPLSEAQPAFVLPSRVGRFTRIMRVIAGKYRSRQLKSLPGLDVRPTADRLRETLFNVLTAGNPSALEGTVWVDLFAGTGAVGIEAISRGASMVHFVESSARSAELIRRNLASLGIGTGFQILKQDSIRASARAGARAVRSQILFSLILPTTWKAPICKPWRTLSKSQLLKPESIVIAEHQKKFDPGESFQSLVRYRKLEQGDAALSFYRRVST